MFQLGIKPGPPQWEASALEKSHLTSLLTGIATPSRVYLIDTGNEGRARDSRTL
jgi:hypothetical protein